MADFGDVRVAQRAAWFAQRAAETGSLVVRRVGEERAGEMAVHRLLSSPCVSVAAIVDQAARATALAAKGRRVVCAQDTSEVNFAGRAKARKGLGPGGDGAAPGFFLHPTIAIDAEEEAVLGLVGAEIWTRGPDKACGRKGRPPEDKESARWLASAKRCAAWLAEAAHITLVGDRESDIFHLFAHRPANVELVVRAAQDRTLAEGGRLFAALAGAPAAAVTDVKIGPRGPGDKGRTARVELRAGPVRLKRPKTLARASAPAEVVLTLVEAREIDAPQGASPILWRLLCTAALTPEAAIDAYRLRWRIEQTFRTLKADGLKLEDTQIHDAARLLRLAAFALAAAVRVMQMVDARDGSSRPASDVLDPALLGAVEAVSAKLEGNTERQKNPHPKGSLAFVSWVCARLGGWNCYYGKPGPKTLAAGWQALAHRIEGYQLALQNPQNV